MENVLKIQIPNGFKIDSFDAESGEIKFVPLPKDIKERVKTIEDACALLSEDDTDVLDYRTLQNARVADHILANQELVIITKALNEGWIPDWHNEGWDKWFNWFNMTGSSSASRFSFSVSDSQLSNSDCGSRLCYKSEKLADYAGKQFEDLYRDYYVID